MLQDCTIIRTKALFIPCVATDLGLWGQPLLDVLKLQHRLGRDVIPLVHVGLETAPDNLSETQPVKLQTVLYVGLLQQLLDEGVEGVEGGGADRVLAGAETFELYSQVKSWVKQLTWLLIGPLFSGSQSGARLAL